MIFKKDLNHIPKLPVDKMACQAVNTPLGFKVCAEGVRLALAPCKVAGGISILDQRSKADQTIVCEKDGKKALQSCAYIPLSQVPDIKFVSGETLRSTLSRECYNEDGCDGSTCICQWGEAKVCQ